MMQTVYSCISVIHQRCSRILQNTPFAAELTQTVLRNINARVSLHGLGFNSSDDGKRILQHVTYWYRMRHIINAINKQEKDIRMSNHLVLLSTGKKAAAISLLVLCAAAMSFSEAADESAANDEINIRQSDIWLEATLVTTYVLNEHLNPLNIDVDLDQGVATITGTVDSEVEKDLAAELAAGIEGIKQVKNELNVQPADASKTADEYGFRERVADANVTARVKSRLLWNAETQGMQINVDTRDGLVSLKGRVTSGAEADLAEQIARNTSGVRDVISQLEVDPDDKNLQQQVKQSAIILGQDINDAWITTKVKTFLLYTKGVDGASVSVVTHDQVVRLTGTLESQDAIARAIRTARGIVGVKDVRSELTTDSIDR